MYRYVLLVQFYADFCITGSSVLFVNQLYSCLQICNSTLFYRALGSIVQSIVSLTILETVFVWGILFSYCPLVCPSVHYILVLVGGEGYLRSAYW